MTNNEVHAQYTALYIMKHTKCICIESEFKCILSALPSHLLTTVHLLTVPVTVARVWVHTDQGTPRVGMVTSGNSQGWEGWCSGCRGGGVFRVSVRAWFTPSYTNSRNRHTSLTATCDGVEYFFGKGGIHRVAMTSNRNHPSSHTPSYAEVISRALVGAQTGRDLFKGKISVFLPHSYYLIIRDIIYINNYYVLLTRPRPLGQILITASMKARQHKSQATSTEKRLFWKWLMAARCVWMARLQYAWANKVLFTVWWNWIKGDKQRQWGKKQTNSSWENCTIKLIWLQSLKTYSMTVLVRMQE